MAPMVVGQGRQQGARALPLHRTWLRISLQVSSRVRPSVNTVRVASLAFPGSSTQCAMKS